MKARDFFRYFLLGAALAIVSRWVRKDFSFRGKVVFITGGSRGLGLALAREFARNGARIALVARDSAELRRAREDLEGRGAEVWTDVCDLRQRDQVEDSIRDALAHFGSLDVLVNNAGEITVGPLETMTPTDFHDAMEIHFWASFYAMNTAVPHLRKRGGRVVNIVSIGGKVAVPHLAPYCASKFALAGLSDAFRAELAKDGVYVTSVFPGLMRTGSHLNAWFRGKHRREFAWFSLGAGLPFSSIDADRAARQIFEACRRGRPQLIITLQARAVVLAASLFPNAVARLMALVNRFLPTAPPGPPAAREVHSGWESQSAATPSALTRLADEATQEYNELRGHEPVRK
jgi:NAD(P)-dependent dehydrogenase (short-subunit alcohol dehydrogenase family)